MKLPACVMRDKPVNRDLGSPEVCETEADLDLDIEGKGKEEGMNELLGPDSCLGDQDEECDADDDDLEEKDKDADEDPVERVTSDTTQPVPPPRSDSHSLRQTEVRLGPDDTEEHVSWDSQWEYILASLGFVNGLGSLLRFPVLVVRHGGGIFFVAYVILMIVFGCPLVYLETAIGQYAGGGPVKAWAVVPLLKGVGFCMLAVTFLTSLYYIMAPAWAIYFLGISLFSSLAGMRLPWDCYNVTDGVCDNEDLDKPRELTSGLAYLPHAGIVVSLTSPASHPIPQSQAFIGALRYFYEEVLDVSASTSHLGLPRWYLVLCLLLAWVLIYSCLIYGPQSIGKVMYFAAPFPYVSLLALAVSMCFVDGSLDGVKYFLSPKWAGLASVEIWMDACQLMVYTLGLGTGCLSTLAGYTHFNGHCFRTLLLICLCNVLGMLVAGFAMSSALGALASQTNTTVSSLDFTEYELGFALYPYMLTVMSESSAFVVLFFFTVIVVGLGTQIIYIQNLVASMTTLLVDYGYHVTTWRRWTLQLALCSLLFLIGIMFTTNGGLYITDFLSHHVFHVTIYITVLLECSILMYIFGGQKFGHYLQDMSGSKDSPWWKFNWKIFTPCILLGLIMSGILFPIPLMYKNQPYPDWSEILGWCLCILPLLLVPGAALIQVVGVEGTVHERIKDLLVTPKTWGSGIHNNDTHTEAAPDYVICQDANCRPMHGLALVTTNIYFPNLIPPLKPNDEGAQGSSSDMTTGYMSDLITVDSTDSVDSDDENEVRGTWRGKLEFLLSCLGYVVGLGNVWRFPYLVYRNGGGAFFIPYLVMLMFCGIPIVYMEMAFGQYASLGPITIWRAVPMFKGVGYAMVVAMGVLAVYYNVVNAWAVHYFIASFSSTLPWSSCGNDWNSRNCALNTFEVANCSWINTTYVDGQEDVNENCSNIIHTCSSNDTVANASTDNVTECIMSLHKQFGKDIYLQSVLPTLSSMKSPSDEYFYNKVLGQSVSLEELGNVQWQLALYLLLCWFIVFVCLVKGIYSAGKVSYFVVIIPTVILAVLFVCTLLVDGHLDGIKFYVTPKWNKVIDPKVWSDAASQVFFSLSAAAGGLTTLSSYNKFHNNIYRDAMLVCLIDTFISVLAGFTVFSSLGILAKQLHTDVENVITSNIGLVFVAFPAAVTNFSPSSMWSVLFFLMIIMLGMSSMLIFIEMIVTAIIDENVEKFRSCRIVVLIVICCVLYLLGLPLTTRGGSHLLQLLDEYCSGIPYVVIGICMCCALAWVYGVKQFCSDIRHMTGEEVGHWWRIMWVVVTPLITVGILISSIISSVDLDPVAFPEWSRIVGIGCIVISVIAIPIWAIKQLCHADGNIIQRVKSACEADAHWGPAMVKHWERKNVEYYPAIHTYSNVMSIDSEHSPIHAVSNHVEITTNNMRVPSLSQTDLLPIPSQQSPRPSTKKAQKLRQRAILNHAYSNPQCNTSNVSINGIKPRLSLPDTQCPDTVTPTPCVNVTYATVATQTDARSYTKALKQGSIKSFQRAASVKDRTTSKTENKVILEVEVTRF